MANNAFVDALRRALLPASARRSLIVALIIGTVLNVINQGDALVSGAPLNYWKIALTFIVPFCVSTYGAYSMALITAKSELTMESDSWSEK